MHPLVHLAVTWTAVLVAVVAAKRPADADPCFLIMGFALVNVGVLPVESDLFVCGFTELGIIFNIFSLGLKRGARISPAALKSG